MNTQRLVINDVDIDLDSKTIIATTIIPFDIKDLTKRSVARTNFFKIPKTQKNLKTFGYIDNQHSASPISYSQLNAVYWQNGYQKIRGYAYVRAVNSVIELAVFEGSIDIFTELKKYDTEILEFIGDTAWVPGVIDSFRTSASSICSPAIDWGRAVGGGNMGIPNFYLPSFYYWNLVEECFAYLGITPSGDILTDTVYKNLVIPYPHDKWEYQGNFVKDHSFLCKATPGTMAPMVAAQNVSAAWTITGNKKGLFTTAGSELKIPAAWTVVSSDTIRFDIRIAFAYISVGSTGDAGKFDIIRKRGGVETSLATQAFSMPGAPATNGNIELIALAVDLRNSDEVYLKYSPTTGTPTTTVSDYTFEGTASTHIFVDLVFWNYLLPSLNMFDLIKDFFLRFGIIDKKVGSTLVLRTIEDIIKDRVNAVDWSAKRVPREDDNIDFSFGYSKENYFNYDDAIDDETRGRGSISIDNENLPESQDIYSSPFANCDYITLLFVTMAKIYVYDSTSTGQEDIKNAPGMRLLYQRQRVSPEQDLYFGGSLTTNYKVGVFDAPGESPNATLQYALDTYYNRLGKSLQKMKPITRYYNLDDGDIESFDKHKMIQDDGYYLVLKIADHQSGKPTKVDLLLVN